MRYSISITVAAALLCAAVLAPGAATAAVNLRPNLPTGWAWPLVPRPTNDATSTWVPLPVTLTGEADATHLNSAWINDGSTASVAFRNHSLLDGATIVVDRSCAALAGGASQMGINGGPFTLPAGRHTLELRVDATNLVTELSEADNNIAHQWVWSPVDLPAGTSVTRGAPPMRTGGWSSIPDGADKYNNCDGLRFTTGMEWDILYTWSSDPAVDVDLRYYAPSTGASNGFASPLGSSLRVGRGVEAVLAKGIGTFTRSYDVGVERAMGTGSYFAQHVEAEYFTPGDSTLQHFAANEMLKVFYVLPYMTGQAAAWLETSAEPSVAMGWIDCGDIVVGLSELSSMTATDWNGRARIVTDVPLIEARALVVWRDPDWGTAERAFGLKITSVQPDLVPDTPAGWHSPLVPRLTTLNVGAPVTLPDTLTASDDGVVCHLGLRNLGVADATDPSEIHVTLDGIGADSLAVASLADGERLALYPDTHTRKVCPGRHTLAMELNHDNTLIEIPLDNNRYGEQYCWGPEPVSTALPVPTLYPGAPQGGFDLVGDGSGEALWPNCAGYRLPTAATTAWWQGFVLRPNRFIYPQMELGLHEALDGTKDGLDEQLVWSMAYEDYTNYVLANLNLTPRRAFDVSVTDWSDYGEYAFGPGFVASYVESQTLGTAGTVTLAPYSASSADDILQLYEWYFPAGQWVIHAYNLSPDDKLGLAFHYADEVYTRRPQVDAVSPAFGAHAWLSINVTEPGWCCVAVFRPGEEDYNPMDYRLSIHPGISPVPGTPELPAATALVGASPNPFNPQVKIDYDLAAPARARLAVFDMRGALVRMLTDADLAAGRQSVTWNGCDDDGRALPSGAYFARFEAGEVRQTRKLMLVR